MNIDRNKIIIGSVLTVVLLGSALGYYIYTRNKQTSATDLQTAATQGVLPSIGEATNPLNNKPDINPTSKTNPFNSVKTNPFQ